MSSQGVIDAARPSAATKLEISIPKSETSSVPESARGAEILNASGTEDIQSSISNGSRYNALKHGLTARTAVLPGENEAAYQAKVDSYKAILEPRNELEDEAAERAAQASWQLDRANGSEVARLTRDILTKPAAEALRVELEAVSLGQRLMHDRRGPKELYPSREYDKQQPRTSWAEESDDPDHPRSLILQLEATLAGCRILLTYWGELRAVLELGMGWQSHEKFACVRLLGKQPINAASAPEVAEVFLACHAVKPRYACAFQELRCEIHEDRFKRHKADLDRWKYAGITPADATAGQAVLLRIVDEATARLRMLEAKHKKLADIVGALGNKILSFDESKAAGQLRRHLVSCDRMRLRNIEAVKKDRRDEARGWGKTRKEREQRKEHKRNVKQGDERLVLDEQGIVHDAVDYVEAALDRYEAKLGYGTPRARRVIAEEVIPPFVPDFARWTAEKERRAEGGGRRMEGDGAEPGCENGSGGAEEEGQRAEGDVAEAGCENGSTGAEEEGRRAEGDVAEAGCENGIGGVEEVEGVPLMLAEEGERANRQNEIGEYEQEARGLPVGLGIASGMNLDDAAERNEALSDAGASERGDIEERNEGRSDAGASVRGDIEGRNEGRSDAGALVRGDAVEGDRERIDAGASERGNDGGEAGLDLADGGVELHDGDPLMITETGERTNQQNETGERAAGDGGPVAERAPKGGGPLDGLQSGSRDQVAGPKGRMQSSKRDQRRTEREMQRKQQARRAKQKRKGLDPAVEKKIRDVEWLFPNMAAVLRDHVPRLP